MDIGDIDPNEWAAAQRRAEVLSKLPERPSGEQIRDAMAALGVGRTTLFRWLKRFERVLEPVRWRRAVAARIPGCVRWRPMFSPSSRCISESFTRRGGVPR
ncbi:MAG: Plasmid replication initiator protein [Methylocystaceae bacterium]|nr:MAG: Plasmid replication initiator [Methylocystaceae bacterium]TXT42329.1 MAG: Plasmid replication initiator protein [Methylocystaceae bacterium]